MSIATKNTVAILMNCWGFIRNGVKQHLGLAYDFIGFRHATRIGKDIHLAWSK